MIICYFISLLVLLGKKQTVHNDCYNLKASKIQIPTVILKKIYLLVFHDFIYNKLNTTRPQIRHKFTRKII